MKKVLIFLVDLYKNLFSGLLKRMFGGGCRYQPTCSDYAKEAIERHGILKGTLFSFKRVVRCNPFGGVGFDPVPKTI